MAGKHLGEGGIGLGAKSYVLRLTFQAVDEIEDMTGLGIFDLARAFIHGGVRVRHMAAIIHACARAAGAGAGTEPGNDLPGVGEISEIMIRDGAALFIEPLGLFLGNALAGGRAPKKTAAGAGSASP